MSDERLQNLIVYVLGMLDELVESGVVARNEGAMKLTEDGLAWYRKLVAEEFDATPEEIEAIAAFLMKGGA